MNKRLLLERIDNLWFSYLLLGLAAFSLSFSNAAVNIFLSASLACFSVAKIRARSLSLKTPISIAFLVFFCASVLSLINTGYLYQSFEGLFKLLKYFLIILITVEAVNNVSRLKAIMLFIWAGLWLSCLNGLYQLIFWHDLIRKNPPIIDIGVPRLTSAFPNANIFGIYLVLIMPAVLVSLLYIFKNDRKIRLALEISFIISAFCLIFTFSRGSALGIIAALLLISVIMRQKIILAVLLLMFLLGPFLLPPAIKDWKEQTSSIGEFVFNVDRMNIYRTSFNMIKDHPFAGVGLNTYSKNYKKYKVDETRNKTSYGYYKTPDSMYAHNHYLQIAAETGLIGFLGFAYLLFALINRWWRFYKDQSKSYLGLISLGIGAGMLGFLVNGLTETALYYSRIAWFFWFGAGLVMAVKTVSERQVSS